MPVVEEKLPIIELDNIRKNYRFDSLDVEVLKGVSLKIHEGEFVAIMGASGSGKSTLMNLIGCLDRPSSGNYKFDGIPVTTLSSDEMAALRCNVFGFIFQRYNLLSKATAIENVEIPSVYAGISHPERSQRAKILLDSFGLGNRLQHFPRQLSGGEQQRIAVARALMNGGRVILADEPTGALDSKSGELVLEQLKAIHKQGHTIIMVTHSGEVSQIAQRVIYIKDGLITNDSGKKHEDVPTNEVPTKKNMKPKLDAGTIFEAIKMAWRSLIGNGYRTLLTMLGIIIGVSSVVTMLALGNGTKAAVLEKIKSIGTNLIVVRSGAPGLRGNFGGTSLSIEDTKVLGEISNVEYSVPEITKQATVRYGENAYLTNVVGTSPEFPLAHDWNLSSGTFFNDSDYKSYAPVAVLGQTIVKNVFNGSDPVGKFFLIGNVPFLIIGVLEAKGASLYGSDQDDTIWVPITTGRARIYGGQSVAGQIFIKVSESSDINHVVDEATSILLTRHKELDFNIRNMESLLATATETQNTLTLFLGSVALIALVVGGIGVMNIMLVSVTERTREIGIRMSVGARAFDVLLQFLTEALVMCTIGGAIGVIIGLIVALIARYFGSDVEFSLAPILLSFGCSFLTGLLFGYLPAKKAAGLDPVMALSME
jgi:macrolide transport system ATP-binding/permease protein